MERGAEVAKGSVVGDIRPEETGQPAPIVPAWFHGQVDQQRTRHVGVEASDDRSRDGNIKTTEEFEENLLHRLCARTGDINLPTNSVCFRTSTRKVMAPLYCIAHSLHNQIELKQSSSQTVDPDETQTEKVYLPVIGSGNRPMSSSQVGEVRSQNMSGLLLWVDLPRISRFYRRLDFSCDALEPLAGIAPCEKELKEHTSPV